jgi:hypothetical protein
MRALAASVLATLLFGQLGTATASWINNGSVLSNAAGDQSAPSAVTDNVGGAIVVWSDFRNASHWDVYAQRVDALGATHWALNGVPVCQATNLQGSVAVVADGLGGAIIAWQDLRNGNYDIFAQRLDGAGVAQWTFDGIPVCIAPGDQTQPSLVADGIGGFLVAWEDTRSGNSDIHVARIMITGALPWVPDGVPVCVAGGEQIKAQIAATGGGAAILAWEDYRAGGDIYARGVAASGTPLWTANGVAICTASNSQTTPRLISDGNGGAMIFWEDARSGSLDIYGDRIDSTGLSQWSANGVAVCTAQYNQASPRVVTDSAGGAIIVWEDTRYTNAYTDIFGQRVSGSGVAQWVTDGSPLSSTSYPYDSQSTVVADGSGGAYVAWVNYAGGGSENIEATHVDQGGVMGWVGSPYVIVTSATSTQQTPTVVLDGTVGALVAWADRRSNVTNDIYAQRIEPRHGFWGRPEPTIDLVADVPGDQGGQVALDWLASQRDVDDRQITHYSIWRATRSTGSTARLETVETVEPQDVGPEFGGPGTWLQSTATGDYFWEWIGNQNAMYFPAYSYTVATRNDSTAVAGALHYFLVVAHYTSTTFWPSNPDSASSVDDLAPLAPLRLAAGRAPTQLVVLTWAESPEDDLRDYALYRSAEPQMTPSADTFLLATPETSYVDTTAEAGVAYYYMVTAFDVHDNESPPSSRVSVAESTTAQSLLEAAGLAVLSNIPNPFRASTTLRFGILRPSDVDLSVFDVRGARMWRRLLTDQPAGWHSVAFEGVDDRGRPLSSGVYVYLVRAAGLERSRQMVVTR